jgi:hypothetical protein
MGSERRFVRWSPYLVCSLFLGILAVPAFAPQPVRAASAVPPDFRPIKCPLCKQHDGLAYSADGPCFVGGDGCRLPN